MIATDTRSAPYAREIIDWLDLLRDRQEPGNAAPRSLRICPLSLRLRRRLRGLRGPGKGSIRAGFLVSWAVAKGVHLHLVARNWGGAQPRER